MYREIKLLIIMSFSLLFPAVFGWSETSTFKPTTVIGFINLGDGKDDNINTLMTKSLTSFLARIKDASVTPYEELEKIALEKGIWKQKPVNIDLAINIAQRFNSKQLIIGNYLSDKKAKKIVITVFVYDTITGELSLKRSYEGSIGLGLFDTIDNMEQNVAGLLTSKPLLFGKLSFELTNCIHGYRLYVNGKIAASMTNGSRYENKYTAGEEMEVSLRQAESPLEVYRENMVLEPDQTKTIKYQPSGSIIVQSQSESASVLLDEKPAGEVKINHSLVLPNIPIKEMHEVSLSQHGSVYESHSVEVKEGSPVIVVFSKRNMMKDVDYFNTLPFVNFILPGFAQFQARDYWSGAVFSGLGACFLGFTLFSVAGYYKSYDKISSLTDPQDKLVMTDINHIWSYFIIGGTVGYLGTGLLSAILAFNQPTYKEQQSTFNMDISPDETRLVYTCLF